MVEVKDRNYYQFAIVSFFILVLLSSLTHTQSIAIFDEENVNLTSSSPDALLYTTFLGSHNIDPRGIATDEEGNTFVTGHTSSSVPIINGFQNYTGGWDGFFAKLNSTGHIEYSTCFGGIHDDMSWDVEIDSFGCPVIGYSVQVYNDGYTIYEVSFILKLNQTYNGVLYNTTLGSFIPYSLVLDSAGYAYVAGTTPGASNSHVARIDPDGVVVYDKVIDGASNDYIYSIALGPESSVYITGQTYSEDFPIVESSTEFNGGTDAFVVQLDSNGDITYSALFGGSSFDHGQSIGVDESNNIYVVGGVQSDDFPVKRPYDGTRSLYLDCFVLMFNGSTHELEYSTFIGAEKIDYVWSAAVSNDGSVYVAGMTESQQFPTKYAFDPSHNGGYQDCFIFKMAPRGAGLVYSTFLGGQASDTALGIAIDSSGSAYVCGKTMSPDFPTVNAETPSGSFVVKIFIEGDKDGDNLSSEEEATFGTDDENPDSDFDLMFDGWEIQYGLDPLHNDANGDLDSDTLTNIEEHEIGTSPISSDSDLDTMPDPYEVENGLNPLIDDSELDLDNDGYSNLNEFEWGSDPRDPLDPGLLSSPILVTIELIAASVFSILFIIYVVMKFRTDKAGV